jgi:transcriptional regulator with XRE-family HTH domain
MTIIERTLSILSDKGLKMSELCQHIGIGTSTLANWKTRNTDPAAKYIIPICEFLNVTPEYLLTGKKPQKKDVSDITEDETKVLKYYNRLNEDHKDLIKGEMVRLYEDEKSLNDVEFSDELAK